MFDCETEIRRIWDAYKLSLQKTLTHEGGYVNDANDLGGETYKGISRNSHPDWSGWTQIDINKHNCNFPKNLDQNTKLQQQVELFYHTNFWQSLKADQITNQKMADSIENAGTNEFIDAIHIRNPDHADFQLLITLF